ncbi:MAG TPA: hypothetical protein VJ875_09835 [Pyrinomonadaceae bacterium]|nr:hypothetical protein [Pyrinomonadaceae bacterium]
MKVTADAISSTGGTLDDDIKCSFVACLTGLHELERLAEQRRATDRTLLLCGARSQPDQLLRQSDLLQFLGEENMLPHVEAALSRAREIHKGRSPDPGTKVLRVDGAVSRA